MTTRDDEDNNENKSEPTVTGRVIGGTYTLGNSEPIPWDASHEEARAAWLAGIERRDQRRTVVAHIHAEQSEHELHASSQVGSEDKARKRIAQLRERLEVMQQDAEDAMSLDSDDREIWYGWVRYSKSQHTRGTSSSFVEGAPTPRWVWKLVAAVRTIIVTREGLAAVAAEHTCEKCRGYVDEIATLDNVIASLVAVWEGED